MIKVFFEHNGIAELVTIFRDEEIYQSCLPALEEQMIKEGFSRITETKKEQNEN